MSGRDMISEGKAVMGFRGDTLCELVIVNDYGTVDYNGRAFEITINRIIEKWKFLEERV